MSIDKSPERYAEILLELLNELGASLSEETKSSKKIKQINGAYQKAVKDVNQLEEG